MKLCWGIQVDIIRPLGDVSKLIRNLSKIVISLGKSLHPNQSAALAKVAEGNLAFLWDGATLDYAAVKSDCVMNSVSLGIAEVKYAFAFRKNSPFAGAYLLGCNQSIFFTVEIDWHNVKESVFCICWCECKVRNYFIEIFSHEIEKFRNQGFLQQLNYTYFRNNDACVDPSK